jgi:crotonobetainyl-CoA:carnitine CoA-transferase CaiB-like acyl-CoA transferase
MDPFIVGNNSLFKTTSEALGHPEWAQEERFRTNSSRVANIGELVDAMTRELRRQPTAHWVQVLGNAGKNTAQKI